ncbi:glycoside hydrolase family 16 protein [Blastococcus sp. URHD0036]|uniref:glycoside hydrolase family 16 protein n=1 Tax=Blastococcus sp. URHD0036 TaxID=1380356 RepID=UPI00068A0702|nr:glycoside hydrolase family 16 protein [Blastococcus sp. URHD0036]
MTTTSSPDREEVRVRPSPAHRRARRGGAAARSWAAWTAIVVVALLAVGAVLLGVARVLPDLESQSTPSPGAWTFRAAAGSSVVDDHDVRWPEATSLRGGRDVAVPGVARGTASPQLYEQARVGARSWTVSVPNPGTYAVDLLVVQPDPDAPAGSDVFDVLADDGVEAPVTLESGVELVPGPALPQHVTGIVRVRSTELTLTFDAIQGEPAVTGLVVTTMGDEPASTLLDQRFDGAAGSPSPGPWRPVTGPGPFGDGEVQGYSGSSRHVALDGEGHLVLQAEPLAYPETWTDVAGFRHVQPWTSARLETEGRFSVTYGTVSAQMQVPPGQGLWPAFWMIGADVDRNPWPLAGEIDVMEHLGGDPATVYSSVRGQGDSLDMPDSAGRRVSRLGSGWTAAEPLTGAMHTYSAQLTPGYVTFAVDGRPYQTVSQVDLRRGQQWPLGKPYYLILNLAVGGSWGGLPDGTTPVPARLLVDSVQVSGWR